MRSVTLLLDHHGKIIWNSAPEPGMEGQPRLWCVRDEIRDQLRDAVSRCIVAGEAFEMMVATKWPDSSPRCYRIRGAQGDFPPVAAVCMAERAPAEMLKLSHREREILSLYAKGLTTRQIARKLRRHVSTITTHRGHIAKKLGFTGRNVEQVIAFATAFFAS